MKRKFTFLTAALALLAFLAIPVGMWGQTRGEISWTASEQNYSNQQEITDVDFDDVVSATFNKGTNSNAPKYYTSGSAIRCYGGNNFVFSTASGNITKIVISFGTGDGSNEITTDKGTYSNGTWTGEAEEITFTIGGTSGNRRIAGFNVTYTGSGSTTVATTTTIDASGITNTDVYTGTAAGSLTATVTETESGNAVSGATVTWTSSKENVATIDENGVVTLVAAGTTTITASYAGVTDEFGASSATYELTVTSSAPYVQPTTIEITPNYEFWGQTAQFSGSTYDNLSGEKDNVTLEWSRGSGSTYANTTAMRFYKDNTLTFTAPDGYEIKSIEISLSTTTTTTSNDLAFSPDGYNGQTTTWTGSSATVTMSRPSNGTSYYTISKYTITLGLPSSDPIINASNVNIAYDATSGEIAYTITNPVTGKTLQATADAGWVSNIEVGAEAITFTTTANEANTERVATFTLTYEGAEDKTVTVTQAAPAPKYTATVGSNISNGTVKIVDGTGEVENIEVEEGTEVTLTATADAGYALGEWNVYKDGDETVKVTVSNNKFNMPAYDVVISATFVEATTYTLITSIDELVSGKRYVIASGAEGSVKAMGSQKNNNREAVEVDFNNGVITGNENVYEFVIIGPDADGFYTLYDVALSKYLYAAGSGNNNNFLRTQESNDGNGRWTISIDASGEATIIAQGNQTNKYMRFNNTLFSCYKETSSIIALPYLYAKDNETTVTKTLSIEGYDDPSNDGGYYLIASPVGQVTPTEANGFLTPDYDLYRFDQAEENEWRNYKQTSFNLVSGHGYLYANSGNVTLTFEGMPYVGNGQVFLSYTEGANWAGWNLIGNPFSCTAYLADSRDFYRMNSTGDGFVLNTDTDNNGGGNAINVCEGIFVVAADANDNSVTFTTTAPNISNSMITFNLTQNRGALIDNARIRFGNGNNIPKFMLNEAHTKLYFTQNGTDYAVVRSEGEGEMPINFKAEHNGTYTIGISAKDMEFSRLRLIDNMTGADIDLLATPSYTFEAKTTDYASRFRLVFSSTGIEENGENANFAYYNGSEWVINATDNATVEVIDMMGRVIRVCTGGVHTLSTNGMASGVYMMRLIDGNNVKTQIIVVE